MAKTPRSVPIISRRQFRAEMGCGDTVVLDLPGLACLGTVRGPEMTIPPAPDHPAATAPWPQPYDHAREPRDTSLSNTAASLWSV